MRRECSVGGRRGKVLTGLVVVTTLGLTGLCTPVGATAQQEPMDAVRALFAAFNAHAPDSMAASVTDDFQLYYVDDAGIATLAVEGPEALRDEMRSYFEARPEVQSRISGVVDGDRFVALREQIVGGASSLAVYEVADGLVRRVWYYPAEGG